MINVIERAQSLDDLRVGLVFFELLATDGDRDGVDTEPRIVVCRVCLDVVDLHAKLADGGNEVLKIRDAFELKVHLEVIGAVFEIALEVGEEGKAANQCKKNDKRYGVKSCTDAKTENAAGPKTYGGGQSLDLTTGAVKDGIDGDDRKTDDRRGGDDVKSFGVVA